MGQGWGSPHLACYSLWGAAPGTVLESSEEYVTALCSQRCSCAGQPTHLYQSTNWAHSHPPCLFLQSHDADMGPEVQVGLCSFMQQTLIEYLLCACCFSRRELSPFCPRGSRLQSCPPPAAAGHLLAPLTPSIGATNFLESCEVIWVSHVPPSSDFYQG